jgi:hypothetical protein
MRNGGASAALMVMIRGGEDYGRHDGWP